MGRTHDVVISGFDLDALERELQSERALADLLASSLLLTLSAWITSSEAERAAASLRVWKEVRSE
jgi:hypothetical protein